MQRQLDDRRLAGPETCERGLGNEIDGAKRGLVDEDARGGGTDAAANGREQPGAQLIVDGSDASSASRDR